MSSIRPTYTLPFAPPTKRPFVADLGKTLSGEHFNYAILGEHPTGTGGTPQYIVTRPTEPGQPMLGIPVTEIKFEDGAFRRTSDGQRLYQQC